VTDAALDRLLADRAGFVARLAGRVACKSVSTDPAHAAGADFRAPDGNRRQGAIVAGRGLGGATARVP
jgi:hypothetical protein